MDSEFLLLMIADLKARVEELEAVAAYNSFKGEKGSAFTLADLPMKGDYGWRDSGTNLLIFNFEDQAAIFTPSSFVSF